MKIIASTFLLIITACASNRIQDEIPPYSKEKVCSNEALIYLKKHSSPNLDIKKYSYEDIRPRLLSLEPAIRKCYEDEMERTNKNHSFNLCLVVGYTKKGTMDFFEFSTREIEISKEFQGCLSNLKDREELIGFKDLSIIQPYRLYPKQ
jgi:hypothetical protein